MTRATKSSALPPPDEHPLEHVVRQLADQVRILRLLLDDLVTEVQWANQNRPCSGSECARFHSPHLEKLAATESDWQLPDANPVAESSSGPLPTTPPTRSTPRDGRLF